MLQSCLTVTPWTVACQAPLSTGFSRQEYWSGLPCPPPGDLPDSRIDPGPPALQADSLPTELSGKPLLKEQEHSFRGALIIVISSVVKNLPANAGDPGSIPRSGRSSGEGNSNLFQYSCLGNPMDRGAWRAPVHGTAESDTT